MRIPKIIQTFMTAQLLLIMVLSSPAAALAQEDEDSTIQSDVGDLAGDGS